MDLHISPGGDIPIEDLIKKHRADLAAQHKYGVEFKSMWINKDKGMVFCLMEGPDKDSCKNVHQVAHGDTGCNIIEVSPGDYSKFLAKSFSNEHDIAEVEKGQMDSGYRTILRFEHISPLHKRHFDVKKVEPFIKKNNGTLLLDPQKSIKAVFVYPAKAFECAKQIRNFIDGNYTRLDYRIAVVSGKPVDQNHDIFYGYATDLSKKLSLSGHKGSIRTTQLTIDLLHKEKGNKSLSLDGIDVLSPPDETFLYQLIETIESNVGNPDLSVRDLATASGLSRSQLFRKVKRLTHYTPNTLIREIRLYKALNLFNQHTDQVAQIAYATGFNSPSYFSKLFEQRFHTLPSDYIRTLKN